MKRLTGWMPVLFLVALAAVALWAAPATATVTVKSTVTIASGEGDEFTGKVGSPKKRCRVGRTVKLYREDTVVGTAKTDRAGTWEMDGSFLAGFYRARVLPLLVHVNGMPIRCGGDYSMRQHF